MVSGDLARVLLFAIPTVETVAVRAYYLFLERGPDAGNEVDDWLRAERELTA